MYVYFLSLQWRELMLDRWPWKIFVREFLNKKWVRGICFNNLNYCTVNQILLIRTSWLLSREILGKKGTGRGEWEEGRKERREGERKKEGGKEGSKEERKGGRIEGNKGKRDICREAVDIERNGVRWIRFILSSLFSSCLCVCLGLMCHSTDRCRAVLCHAITVT